MPLLLLPLLVPVVIAGSQATEPAALAARRRPRELGMAGLLALYDMVFVLVSVAVFDFLLED